MSEADLSARIGIARSTLQLIEKGDPRVEIGLAFEAAALAGVDLFVPEATNLAPQIARVDDKLALLPQSIPVAEGEASTWAFANPCGAEVPAVLGDRAVLTSGRANGASSRRCSARRPARLLDLGLPES